MEALLLHVNENWRVYTLLIFLVGCLAIFWLSKYFATKKDFAEHKSAFIAHRDKFEKHQIEHFRLRDTVHAIDAHLKHLPSSKESQKLSEQLAKMEGRLEGLEPLFKSMLNNQSMLIQNELDGSKQKSKS